MGLWQSMQDWRRGKEFTLASDPRVLMVSRVEDFARLDDKNILAATMPNPAVIPTKPAEIAAILEAATGQVFYGKSVPSEMLLPGDQEIRRITILRDIVHESVEVSVDPRLTIVCYQ